MNVKTEILSSTTFPEFAELSREIRLLKRRELFLSEAVTSVTARKFVSDLLFLDSENHNPITLYVNSPGGEVNSGFSIYDTIRYIKSPVTIMNTGLCASIATIINIAVPSERRHSMPNARFLIHQPLISGQMTGTASDIEITAQEILKTRSKINELLAEACKQTIDKVSEDTERDYWMNAEEAVEYGLISKIVTKRLD